MRLKKITTLSLAALCGFAFASHAQASTLAQEAEDILKAASARWSPNNKLPDPGGVGMVPDEGEKAIIRQDFIRFDNQKGMYFAILPVLDKKKVAQLTGKNQD